MTTTKGPAMPKMKEYEVTVVIKVKAEQDCDAETSVVFALDHAHLMCEANDIYGYEVVEVH